MSHASITAVLFDLDNTLIDRSEAFARLFGHWYDTLPTADRPSDREAFVSRMANYGIGYAPIPDIYSEMLEVWLGSFPSLDAAVEAHFRVMPEMVGLHPKSDAMLRRFKDQGVPVGVVTNGGTATQWGKLRKTGIAELVTACVVSEEFGAWKPDPAIFGRALALIDSEAGSTVFVGDNAEHDILGAAGVGMRTAWMSLGREWEIESARPDYVLNAVWETEDIVAF
ncbi:MAG: HAD family hydrolase [Dehalococcoidia bacterium]|nr:HAD family hydrolase [Dehalococcoidia bacterium]